MLGVLGSQKRALMMIEPPGEMRVARILEIHNGVLVAIEKLRLENLRGFVGHAGVSELGAGVKRTFHEAAEEGRGGRAVEAVVVVENPDAHAVARKKTY